MHTRTTRLSNRLAFLLATSLLLLSSTMSSNALASNIFFVWEGAEIGGDDGAVSLALRDEYVSLLTGAGHSVMERALTTFVSGGTATQNNGATDVIAGSLNASFDQVWVVNIVGSATPQNLSANDLSALSSWSAANSRDEWILDGLSWRGVSSTPRGNMNTDEGNFTINMANVLEGAGGGILVGTDNEQGPLANPADGSGSLVATVNQVLDEFNFDLFFGAYRTPASSFTFGGSFFSGPGSLPATPTNFDTSTGSYAEIPGRFAAQWTDPLLGSRGPRYSNQRF